MKTLETFKKRVENSLTLLQNRARIVVIKALEDSDETEDKEDVKG